MQKGKLKRLTRVLASFQLSLKEIIFREKLLKIKLLKSKIKIALFLNNTIY